MRIAHLILVSLLAAALAACGEGGDDPSNNNPGGSGGTGGTGGAEPIDCGGVRVVELESAATAVLNDRTDTVGNWVGSCMPPDTAGNDVIVHYKVPEAGHYRFSTAGSDFDTLIYAYSDCNDGFTELKCNDDFGSKQSAFTLLDRQAGEEVFVVVDSVGIRESRPFTLSVNRITAAAPTVDTMEAYFNGSVDFAGVRLTGRNPDAAVAGFSMQLYGLTGTALLPEPFVARFDQVEILRVTQADGAFTVEGSFSLGEGAPAVGAIEFSVFDENELPSETRKEQALAPPEVARGEACDPNRALNVCAGSDYCIARDPEVGPVCSVATRPDLTTATAYKNLDDGFWGVVVEGVDPESDVTAARLLPKKETGTSIPIGEAGATVVPFHHLGHDEGGAYRGVVALSAIFNGPCLPAANQAYADCVNGGGNQQACYDQAVALLLQCYEDNFLQMVRVDVEVVDASNKLSTKLTVDLAPTPAADLGGQCDPYGATGACSADAVCWSEEPVVPETCRAEGPTCPAEFGAIDLNGHASGTRWIYTGNNAAATVRDGGSCGSNGPADAFSFTAPSAGNYTFSTGALGSGVDTTIVVRPYCQLVYELACNDDTATSDTASRVGVSLDAGETVYLFVGSADGTATGDYTLTVSGS